ncbi:MAG: hypothetical protein K8L99_31550 [Anaerolineae bacterium]|nr:hypothetical protein [Anaerolineae bacterium]
MKLLPIDCNSEKLAYWYFRLNGCFTIENFVIHPDKGRQQRTDVDIMAIRLPYRSELLQNPMQDDPPVLSEGNRIKLILAEVKQEVCNLNGPWTDRNRSNMQRAISAAGPFPPENIEAAAKSLYDTGVYQNDILTMTLFCVGRKENRELRQRYPNVPQITWQHILGFIYDRFTNYREQKSSHPQWNKYGSKLFRTAINSKTKEAFINSINI